MKPLVYFVCLLGLWLAGCSRQHVEATLTEDQRSAVQKMENALQAARMYNDTLARLGGMDRTRALHLDRRYHDFLDELNACHNNYLHNTNSADHFHSPGGGMGMHNQGNGMMGGACNCCSNGGHRAELHHQYNALQQQHLRCHP